MQVVMGLDEVGRGCWAGPLAAGAVVLRGPITGLRDSKKLSKKRREQLAATIQIEALAHAVAWVTPEAIDSGGITAAVKQAMREAADQCLAQLAQAGITDVQIVVDGHINYLAELPGSSAIIKADDTVPAVSAASILAKVARDNYMAEMAIKHPHYGFEKHVGYGTAEHIAALKQYGICELHRLSYKPIQQLRATL